MSNRVESFLAYFCRGKCEGVRQRFEGGICSI